MNKENTSAQDVMAVLIRIQEQVTALDRKVDILAGRTVPPASQPQSPARSSFKPSFQDPVHAHDPVPGITRPQPERKARPMHQVTCAECKKECEIPFKPSGDRPVYCRECFSRRKNEARAQGGVQKPLVHEPVAPSVEPVVPAAAAIPAALVKEKKKPAAVKKPVARKKTVIKKKK